MAPLEVAKNDQGLILLTHPRSASNLFQKMLSEQPSVYRSGYNFYDAALPAFAQIRRGRLSDLSEADREAIFQPYKASYESMCKEIETAGKQESRLLLNEHALFLFGPDVIFAHFHPSDSTSDSAPKFQVGKRTDPPKPTPTPTPTPTPNPNLPLPHSNPTCLPDTTLLSLRPIFQIRSPLLMFPSMVRAGLAAPYPYLIRQDPDLSLRYSRELYDWYAAQEGAAKALIIDADDIIGSRATVRRLCLETGLDPDAVKYEWETTVEENPVKAKFKARLNGSTGILPGLSAEGLSVECEEGKWREEFGEEDGEVLVGLVRAALPDYEYLWSRRVVG